MPAGGKRPGSGRKSGKRDFFTTDGIRQVRPKAEQLLEQILDAALKEKKLSAKVLAFKEVAPYILKKQPQDIDHRGKDGQDLFQNITVTIVRANQDA